MRSSFAAGLALLDSARLFEEIQALAGAVLGTGELSGLV
jgi:hypothetical protein